MVLKLIKNEFIDSQRKFLPLLATILGMGVLFTLMTISGEYINQFFVLTGLVVLLIVALSIATIVLSAIGYIDLLYVSLYKTRGYKLFTMPVKTWEILIAKVAVALIWTVIIFITATLSASLFFFISTNQVREIYDVVYRFLIYLFGSFDLGFYVITGLSILSDYILEIIVFLFAGSIVNSHFIQNKRPLFMVVAYLLLTYLISNIVVNILGNFDFINFTISDIVLINPSILENFDPLTTPWETLFAVSTNPDGLRNLALLTLFKISLSGVLAYATVWFWNHKLEIIE